MRAVSATKAKQSFAEVLDTAQREPVVIRRHKRDIAVLVSPQEYERIHRQKVAELNRFADRISEQAAARGMNEAVLEQLLADEDTPAPGH